MTEQAALWAAVLPVIRALEALDVPYYIGGSVAGSFTGVARSTQDADLIADLRPAHAFGLVRALEGEYYISEERVVEAIRNRRSFNLVHLGTAFKIDLFVLPDGAFARQAMARRIALDVPAARRSLDFCSPEDLVLAKLLWYEEGGKVSDRQWQDLQGILRLRGKELDLAYLEHWARQLGLGQSLATALSEAGLG